MNITISAIMILISVLIFAGVLIYIFVTVSGHIKRFSNLAFGTSNLLKGLKENEAIYNNTPKSLSGMDTVVIPKIKRDFPDFNVELAKSYAKEELNKHLDNPNGFHVHDVAFKDYIKHNNTRTIIMQAAFETLTDGQKHQDRYSLNYTYMPTDSVQNQTLANCPNCGAPAPSTGETVCAYCGSRVFITLENAWVFTEIYKS